MKTNVLGSDLLYNGTDIDRKSKVDGLLEDKRVEFFQATGLIKDPINFDLVLMSYSNLTRSLGLNFNSQKLSKGHSIVLAFDCYNYVYSQPTDFINLDDINDKMSNHGISPITLTDTNLPTILNYSKFSPFLNYFISIITENYSNTIVLHEIDTNGEIVSFKRFEFDELIGLTIEGAPLVTSKLKSNGSKLYEFDFTPLTNITELLVNLRSSGSFATFNELTGKFEYTHPDSVNNEFMKLRITQMVNSSPTDYIIKIINEDGVVVLPPDIITESLDLSKLSIDYDHITKWLKVGINTQDTDSRIVVSFEYRDPEDTPIEYTDLNSINTKMSSTSIQPITLSSSDFNNKETYFDFSLMIDYFGRNIRPNKLFDLIFSEVNPNNDVVSSVKFNLIDHVSLTATNSPPCTSKLLGGLGNKQYVLDARTLGSTNEGFITTSEPTGSFWASPGSDNKYYTFEIKGEFVDDPILVVITKTDGKKQVISIINDEGATILEPDLRDKLDLSLLNITSYDQATRDLTFDLPNNGMLANNKLVAYINFYDKVSGTPSNFNSLYEINDYLIQYIGSGPLVLTPDEVGKSATTILGSKLRDLLNIFSIHAWKNIHYNLVFQELDQYNSVVGTRRIDFAEFLSADYSDAFPITKILKLSGEKTYVVDTSVLGSTVIDVTVSVPFGNGSGNSGSTATKIDGTQKFSFTLPNDPEVSYIYMNLIQQLPNSLFSRHLIRMINDAGVIDLGTESE